MSTIVPQELEQGITELERRAQAAYDHAQAHVLTIDRSAKLKQKLAEAEAETWLSLTEGSVAAKDKQVTLLTAELQHALNQAKLEERQAAVAWKLQRDLLNAQRLRVSLGLDTVGEEEEDYA